MSIGLFTQKQNELKKPWTSSLESFGIFSWKALWQGFVFNKVKSVGLQLDLQSDYSKVIFLWSSGNISKQLFSINTCERRHFFSGKLVINYETRAG